MYNPESDDVESIEEDEVEEIKVKSKGRMQPKNKKAGNTQKNKRKTKSLNLTEENDIVSITTAKGILNH